MTPALNYQAASLIYINKLYRVGKQYPKIKKKLEKQTEIEDTSKEQKQETVEDKNGHCNRE